MASSPSCSPSDTRAPTWRLASAARHSRSAARRDSSSARASLAASLSSAQQRNPTAHATLLPDSCHCCRPAEHVPGRHPSLRLPESGADPPGPAPHAALRRRLTAAGLPRHADSPPPPHAAPRPRPSQLLRPVARSPRAWRRAARTAASCHGHRSAAGPHQTSGHGQAGGRAAPYMHPALAARPVLPSAPCPVPYVTPQPRLQTHSWLCRADRASSCARASSSAAARAAASPGPADTPGHPANLALCPGAPEPAPGAPPQPAAMWVTDAAMWVGPCGPPPPSTLLVQLRADGAVRIAACAAAACRGGRPGKAPPWLPAGPAAVRGVVGAPATELGGRGHELPGVAL